MLTLVLSLAALQQLAHAGLTPDTVPAGALAARAERAASAPRIDGRLDDEAWAAASPITQFRQRDPAWGEPASERTEARVLYTSDALYVAVRAFDSQPEAIRGVLTRRDAGSPSDWLAVAVDAQHDRRTAYHFAVNAAGVQRDVFRFNDVEEDDSWNAVWDVAVARDAEGWSAEWRIPFSQLRLPAGSSHRFGFNILRRIARTGEWAWWRIPEVGRAGFVSAFGDLEGIEGVQQGMPLELTPYLLSGRRMPAAQAGNPFRTADMVRALGADIRAALPGNLTLTGAINPDFGQVEADPAVLNLSAGETFLPERRPFFAEGTNLFRLSLAHSPWSAESMFYSRRIGRAPQLSPDPRGGFAEILRPTTIVGAAKITGRVAPGWNVGFLSALTSAEHAAVTDSAGLPHRDVVEPRTLYTVARLNRELRSGQTVLGAYGTLVARDLPAEVTALRSRALVLGSSLEHRFGGDRWHILAQLNASRVTGSQEAITATQRSSVRYFQRPDDGIALDSARTSLGGHAGVFEAARRAGRWTGGLRLAWRSPAFEANDAGFQLWAAQRFGRAHLTRRWLTPGRVFNRFELTAGYNSNFAWSGPRIMGAGELTALYVTRGNWFGETTIWYRLGGRDPSVLRGGPALALPRNWFARQTIETDGRKPVWFGATVGAWRYDEGTWEGVWGVGRATWRAAPGVELQLAPRFDVYDDARGYLATVTWRGQPVYVMAQRLITSTGLGFRANATLSPRLSFEAFAEPFMSRARSSAIRTVADPHAERERDRFTRLADGQLVRDGDRVGLDLDRDGAEDADIGTPDFTMLSLRANVVLRWEFKPASALFLVWQHGRERSIGHDMGLGQGLEELGRVAAENALLVKVSYWLRLR